MLELTGIIQLTPGGTEHLKNAIEGFLLPHEGVSRFHLRPPHIRLNAGHWQPRAGLY
jgi:hypothetical protein